MDSYIIVCKDGNIEELSNLKLANAQTDKIFFICQKRIINSYGYGEHTNYTFCDSEGNAVPLAVGNISLFSFRTYGVQRNFILSWKYEHSGIHEEYELHRDNIWYYPPSFDYEWENPINDTIRLIQDISRFGLDARNEIDSLKREIYSTDMKIRWSTKRYSHLIDIDYEKSGLHPKSDLQLPLLEKEYKRISDAKSRFNAKEAMDFLREEMTKRKRALTLLEEHNKELSMYASSIEVVFVKEGVTTIKDEQFKDCKNAREIFLPPSVTSIIHTAFNFTPVESVYITSPARVDLVPSFPASGIMLTNATFYVRSELIERYRTNLFWKSLSDRILPIKDDSINPHQSSAR